MLISRVARIERESVVNRIVGDTGRQRRRNVDDRQTGSIIDIRRIRERIQRADTGVFATVAVTAPLTVGASLVPVIVQDTEAAVGVGAMPSETP
jgi:hypothetical protein